MVDESLVSLPGYNFVRKDRNSRAGGVALYVKETLSVRRLDLLDTVFQRIISRLYLVFVIVPRQSQKTL
jgi:hypothetical protein